MNGFWIFIARIFDLKLKKKDNSMGCQNPLPETTISFAVSFFWKLLLLLHFFVAVGYCCQFPPQTMQHPNRPPGHPPPPTKKDNTARPCVGVAEGWRRAADDTRVRTSKANVKRCPSRTSPIELLAGLAGYTCHCGAIFFFVLVFCVLPKARHSEAGTGNG